MKDAELLMLDFILADDDYKHESLRRAIVLTLEGEEIKVATPEDMILLKLLSGRSQDLVDTENIILIRKDSLDRDYLHRWAESLSVLEPLNHLWNR